MTSLALAALIFSAPAHALTAADVAGAAFSSAGGPQVKDLGVGPLALRPARGTVSGPSADLVFDRRAWTVKGGVNGGAVDLFIDHEARTIKGGANGSPVDLVFWWSTERIITRGGANLSQVELLLDWNAKTLTGTANNAPLRVSFDLETGRITGHAKNAAVDLAYDKVSGRISGGLAGRPFDATLTNLDLSDFLQHFYLFLK